MAQKQTAIVIGATGLTGRAVVAQLARDARYARVVTCVRRLTDFDANVVTHVIDFDALIASPEALARSFETLGLTEPIHAFCCLGTTIKIAGSQDAFRRVDFDAVVAFAKAMRALGAAHLGVVSALGPSQKSPVFYSRVKAEMEAAVAAVGIASINFLRPSFLEGDRAANRPGEKVGILLAKLIQPALIGSLRRYRVVHADAVAATLIREANAASLGLKITQSECITLSQ